MRYKVNATRLKEWFQYACDRKFLYSSSDIEKHTVIEKKDSDMPTEHAGDLFENRIVQKLHEDFFVVELDTRKINPGRYQLLWRRFLSCHDKNDIAFAAQAKVEGEHLSSHFILSENVFFSHGYIDLVKRFEVDGQLYVQIIDVKNSPVVTHFHRIQVAFYALLLEKELEEMQKKDLLVKPIKVYSKGEIWKTSELEETLWESEEFYLETYQREIEHFIHNDLERLRTISVYPEDHSSFHLYYKCEQCTYQPHCHKSVEKNDPSKVDLSAIYGLTQYSKRRLRELGFGTVGDIARLPVDYFVSESSWKLRDIGTLVVQRAQSLVEQKTIQREGAQTLHMPSQVDCPVYIVADRNPNQGHLISLGIFCTDIHGAEQQFVRIMDTHEREKEVLFEFAEWLFGFHQEIHDWNVSNPDSPKTTHCFFYEKSEVRDIQNSLSKYVEESDIGEEFVELFRIFPPEGVLPDHSYHRYKRTPHSVVRGIIEDVYVVPAKVSYDLARVTRALSETTSFDVPYVPADDFAHPYSSRLSLEYAERFSRGDFPSLDWPDMIADDVKQRLQTLRALTQWLMKENTNSAHPFLCLRKEPFTRDAQNPLEWMGLTSLKQQTLLGKHTSQLNHLLGLTKPITERVSSRSSYGNLILDSVSAPENNQRAYRVYLICEEVGKYDLSPSTYKDKILHQEEPEVLFEGSEDRLCVLAKVQKKKGSLLLEVHLEKKVYEQLQSKLIVGSLWSIDKSFRSTNQDRVVQFLDYLIGEENNAE